VRDGPARVQRCGFRELFRRANSTSETNPFFRFGHDVSDFFLPPRQDRVASCRHAPRLLYFTWGFELQQLKDLVFSSLYLHTLPMSKLHQQNRFFFRGVMTPTLLPVRPGLHLTDVGLLYKGVSRTAMMDVMMECIFGADRGSYRDTSVFMHARRCAHQKCFFHSRDNSHSPAGLSIAPLFEG